MSFGHASGATEWAEENIYKILATTPQLNTITVKHFFDIVCIR
jgi:hypothetical protein